MQECKYQENLNEEKKDKRLSNLTESCPNRLYFDDDFK